MAEEKKQLTEGQKNQLRKQQYGIIGEHSAVKICGWTKKMLRSEGGCYKFKFYGIRSHQCMQMTTSMYCASRCKFCWRGQKAPVGKKWYGPIDNPKEIISKSLEKHEDFLKGFGGYKKLNKKAFIESKEVRHVALSLTGEPITYPKINEILANFHKKKISTFLVTNAQFPEQIEKIENVTQLYISLDGANKKVLKEIDRPLFKDYWERLKKSLEILATRKYRTCIRLTLIKDENMDNFEEYAKLIKLGNPDFIELKSYMWVGGSQKYYKVQNMPYMNKVKEFSKELEKHLPDYKIVDQHLPSRVVLMIKKRFKNKKYINFPKFFELVNSGENYNSEDYSSKKMMPNI
jgi:tRNA wybutosine-synthesizing protein 1